MQGEVQIQVYDSAQTSCGSVCIPLPTPQKGWVTARRFTEEFKARSGSPPHSPYRSFCTTSQRVYPSSIFFLHSSHVLVWESGQTWAMGRVVPMRSGSEHLFAAETTDQRGKESREGSGGSKSGSNSSGNLISTFGWGPSLKEHRNAGLTYRDHDKAVQNTRTPNPPQFYPISPLDLPTPLPRNRGGCSIRLWSGGHSQGDREFSPLLFQIPLNVAYQSHDQLFIPQICNDPLLSLRHCLDSRGTTWPNQTKILAFTKMLEKRDNKQSV